MADPTLSIVDQQALDQVDEYLSWLLQTGAYTIDQARKVRSDFINDLLQPPTDATTGLPKPFYSHPLYRQAQSYIKTVAAGKEPTLTSSRAMLSTDEAGNTTVSYAPFAVVQVVAKEAVQPMKQLEDSYKEYEAYDATVAQQQAVAKRYEQVYGLAGGQPGTSAFDIAEKQRVQGAQAKAEQVNIDRAQREASLAEQGRAGAAEFEVARNRAAAERARSILTPPPIDNTQLNTALTGLVKGQANTNLADYISKNLGGVFDQFEAAFPGARTAWNAALRPYSPYEGSIGTPVGISNQYQSALNLNYAVAGYTKSLGGSEATGLTPFKDPLATLAETYPWYKEFMMKAPEKRGWQPQRYAPSARWFTG